MAQAVEDLFSKGDTLSSDSGTAKKIEAGCQWLVPVVLAAQEAEIRRITVQSQTWENSSGDTISEKKHHKKGLVEWLKV
jgi:hypothetical protein